MAIDTRTLKMMILSPDRSAVKNFYAVTNYGVSWLRRGLKGGFRGLPEVARPWCYLKLLGCIRKIGVSLKSYGGWS